MITLKHLIPVSVAFLVVLGGCTATKYVSTSETDDVYYSSKDETKVVDYTKSGTNQSSGDENYEKNKNLKNGSGNGNSDPAYNGETDQFSYLNSNSWSNASFYSPFMRNSLFFGSPMCMNMGPTWNMGWNSYSGFSMGIGMGFGTPWMSPYCNSWYNPWYNPWSYNGFYNPYSYWYDPFYGYGYGYGYGNSYWNGYMNGYMMGIGSTSGPNINYRPRGSVSGMGSGIVNNTSNPRKNPTGSGLNNTSSSTGNSGFVKPETRDIYGNSGSRPGRVTTDSETPSKGRGNIESGSITKPSNSRGEIGRPNHTTGGTRNYNSTPRTYESRPSTRSYDSPGRSSGGSNFGSGGGGGGSIRGGGGGSSPSVRPR